MICGTVKIYHKGAGYGLVAPDGEAYDIVVQASLLRRLGISILRQGQRVRCSVEADRHGRPSASDISVI